MKRTFQALILTAFLLVVTAAPSAAEERYPLSSNDPQIRSAVDYVLFCQNTDGGFNNEPRLDASNLKATANAAMALALTGDLNRAVKSGKTPLAYLTENGPDDTVSGGALGKYVMGLVAAGGDPFDVGGTDYVTQLKTKASFRGEENLFSEAYILLGLIAAGQAESLEAQDFVAYLMDKRNPDSGWGWGGGAPDLDTTGIVVCALVGAGVPADSQPIKDAVDYLKSQQNEDGGFPSSGMSADSNSISDNWAIMALNAAGVDPTEWRKGAETPITHLLSCQQESGVIWWKPKAQGSAGFLMEETAYGIISLLGEWIPIEATAPGEEVKSVTVTIHVLGDGAELFSGEVTLGAESFAKNGFDISNPTVLGALQETGTDYTLGDPAGTGSPIVSDLAGSGAAIYFVNGARQSDPIGEYDLTGDECIVVNAPDTVLPLRMNAPEVAITGTGFTIKVSSEDLDGEGNPVEAPLKGATVTVQSDTLSFEYTTDEEGNTPEIVLNVPGVYRAKAEKSGYIGTFYLNCGYQVINCISGEPVDVTIHVLNNGVPLFSGEVEVPTARFQKDGFWIDNPTALGALEVTGVGYSLNAPNWIRDVAGYGAPIYYVDGIFDMSTSLNEKNLNGGEWITITAPYTIDPLYINAPDDAVVGDAFDIEIYSENWMGVKTLIDGATVVVEGDTTASYTTDANGIASVTLNSAGDYKVKAENAGYIGTYYMIPGGYKVIHCDTAATTTVKLHILKNGVPVYNDEIDVPSGNVKNAWGTFPNPTVLGALNMSGRPYTMGDPWGSYTVLTIEGVGYPSEWMPVYYVNGVQPLDLMDQKYLGGGEWITISTPGSIPELYFKELPTDVGVGETFEIVVYEKGMDTSTYATFDRPIDGATVYVGTNSYSTSDGGKATVTLVQTGKYDVTAAKDEHIGTYFLTSGGYQFVTVTGESGVLSVTKSADRSSAEPGDILTYDIEICNDDTFPVTKVNVTDVLQMGSTLQSADPWPNETIGNELKWNVSEIVAGGREKITLGVKVPGDKPSGYTLQNCVNVNALNDTEVLIGASDCEEVFIGVRDPLVVTKTADKESVVRGKKVEYTIKVFNLDNSPITDVVVKDVFSRDVEFVSANPSPTRSYSKDERFSEMYWTFDSIEKRKCLPEITLEVIVPEMQDFEFDMELGMKGEGFVNVANDYSTTPPEYLLENNVYVSAKNSTKSLVEALANANVAVTDPGTELSTREHGSGLYESDQVLKMRTANKSISMEKDVSAEYETTTLGLYNNRSVTYSSRWTEEACAKNRLKSTTMHESYRYATNIDRESQILLDDKGSSLAVESEFEGMGHIGILQKSDPHALPDFVSSDDYTGSFKVSQKAESSSIKYEKSATGTGFVVADKRIGDKQRSYEHGTGLYESDEVIEAATNYIAKDISLVYQPTTFDFGSDLLFDSTNKWKEGIRSKSVETNNTTLISEEFSEIDWLDKETLVRGLRDVATEAEFSGKARFRAIYVDTSTNDSENETLQKKFRKPQVEIDDEYLGNYSVQRRVVFAGAYEYDEPHISVSKSGEIFYEDDAILARYNISAENDGNRALGPLFIKDLLPPGAVFINASERPSKLSAESAEWTFVNLGLGGRLDITLWLNVTDYRGDELVNRVVASGGYNGGEIKASNFSAIEIDWLRCCQDGSISATKEGKLDRNEPNVVLYTLDLENLDESTKAVRVTDFFPEGMIFLNASIEPASIEGNAITWNLIDIGPNETVSIVYRAEALRSGRFVNRAEIDARSIDGSSTPVVYANAVVDVPKFEGEVVAPGWQPPDWGFEYKDYPNNLTCEEICKP